MLVGFSFATLPVTDDGICSFATQVLRPVQ